MKFTCILLPSSPSTLIEVVLEPLHLFKSRTSLLKQGLNASSSSSNVCKRPQTPKFDRGEHFTFSPHVIHWYSILSVSTWSWSNSPSTPLSCFVCNKAHTLNSSLITGKDSRHRLTSIKLNRGEHLFPRCNQHRFTAFSPHSNNEPFMALS